MVQLNPFEERVIATLATADVPVNTVSRDGVKLIPWGGGYQLRWDGVLYLTETQAAALLGPHTGDTTCATCYAERTVTSGEQPPLIYCNAPDSAPIL